jgi:dsRNA-specific ribonuclease
MNKMSLYETNPVGALQERYQSRGILPSYQVVQFEGMSHNPTFTYQVFIGDMAGTGSGNSKKQAKHAAARKTFFLIFPYFKNRFSGSHSKDFQSCYQRVILAR